MIFRVADSSEVSVVRRASGELSRELGLDETQAGRAAIVATEMATNLLKHGGGGEIVLDRFADDDGSGLELLSLDKGRGMADLPYSMTDGVSTAGSAGTGLGAIRRQADQFAIFSRPGAGTAVMARFCTIRPPLHGPISIGAVVAPFPGETQCGDAWAYANGSNGPTILAVDGSGHGAHAALAARTVIEAFRKNSDAQGPSLVTALHRALAPTRGAALAVARVDAREHLVRYVGVGNISGALIVDGSVRRMVSHNGTAGHVAPRIREFTYPYSGTVTVILHSDGLSAKWDMEAYPGLATSHPSLIAGVLFRDHRRERDDASIAVLRASPGMRGAT